MGLRSSPPPVGNGGDGGDGGNGGGGAGLLGLEESPPQPATTRRMSARNDVLCMELSLRLSTLSILGDGGTFSHVFLGLSGRKRGWIMSDRIRCRSETLHKQDQEAIERLLLKI